MERGYRATVIKSELEGLFAEQRTWEAAILQVGVKTNCKLKHCSVECRFPVLHEAEERCAGQRSVP